MKIKITSNVELKNVKLPKGCVVELLGIKGETARIRYDGVEHNCFAITLGFVQSNL